MANIAGKEVPLQQSLKRMRLVLTVLTSQILLLLHHIYARNNFLLQLQRELTGTSKTLHAKCFYLIVSFVKVSGQAKFYSQSIIKKEQDFLKKTLFISTLVKDSDFLYNLVDLDLSKFETK